VLESTQDMPRQRTVFVSCGQLTEPEKALGREVSQVIEARGMTAFFAQDVHSAGDLNSEVFRAIQTCDAFLAILQKRGTVTFADYRPVQRSSVWIQQEIAMFCYRMFLEQRSLPLRVYSERGIRREGVMEIAVVNPIEFDRDREVIAGVDAWLKSREFEEHPVLARREELFRARLARTSDDQLLLLELIAAHCPDPGDSVLYHVVSGDFHAVLNAPGAKESEEIERRFRGAFSTLNRLELIGMADQSLRTGTTAVWIAKQWWHLLLDELRNRGRRV